MSLSIEEWTRSRPIRRSALRFDSILWDRLAFAGYGIAWHLVAILRPLF
jgi:hypothetical protein